MKLRSQPSALFTFIIHPRIAVIRHPSKGLLLHFSICTVRTASRKITVSFHSDRKQHEPTRASLWSRGSTTVNLLQPAC